MQVAAQTYDNLWKQAEINAQKAQPKSEIAVMKKIIAKASAAKDYGQLLAAEIRQMALWKEISADSLTPEREADGSRGAEGERPRIEGGEICRAGQGVL